MFPNKQTPPAFVNKDEIYFDAEANSVESPRAQVPETEEERQQTRTFQKKSSSSAVPIC